MTQITNRRLYILLLTDLACVICLNVLRPAQGRESNGDDQLKALSDKVTALQNQVNALNKKVDEQKAQIDKHEQGLTANIYKFGQLDGGFRQLDGQLRQQFTAINNALRQQQTSLNNMDARLRARRM